MGGTDSDRSALGSRAVGIVVSHPRLVTALLVSLLLLASADTAAAWDSFVTTHGEGITNTGP
ncbi:hypothetical protein [Halorarum halobium]|uniref:hypothetical protein n=1 Tax=Halorarum halobium TaxID=3075121 RepID=UPI0028ACBF41|nr:hypothetical protein [Halobaculum sp. XH14]